MFKAITVTGFRGLRRLEVGTAGAGSGGDGFGRVNLIIGKNDCGKTTLMEAVAVAHGAEDGVGRLSVLQGLRDADAPVEQFDRFWLPIFSNQDADRGFSIESITTDGSKLDLQVRKAKAPPAQVRTSARAQGTLESIVWALDVEVTKDGKTLPVAQAESAGDGLVRLPQATRPRDWAWIRQSKDLNEHVVREFTKLKQGRRESGILELLRAVDPLVSDIEIGALVGTKAEVFIRLAPDSPSVPLTMMGDGFQRCFQICVVAAGGPEVPVFIDEIDTGIHHSVLEPLWRWLAAVSSKRNLQVFATTHSEECIQAACGAFAAMADDGLRVIRLDRREDRTTAAIYDHTLVRTAAETGIEIRG